jgi:hypothetical protein
MKKYIILGLSVALAVFSTTSCNPDLLNIQQKGVIAYEDFYQTDEDAESALVAAYTSFISVFSAQGSNNPAWNVVVNACGDELYWGGGKKDGSSSGAQDMNEFRNTYDSTVPHIRVIYKSLYSLIYKCNLIIDNFYGEDGSLCDSQVKKRCVAEARTLRAWAHFTAATFWGTPPLVEHVLSGDARPTNCDHQVLMDWCISEFKAAIPDLEARKGKSDKAGAFKITSGAAYAFLGKAQVFNKDWNGAKESLKKVIDSGNYALAPTEDLWNMFHMAGDGNEEKILEGNFVDNENISKYSFAQYHYQRNQALFIRNIKKYPSVLLQAGDGWGNNVSPTKQFMDAIMKHEPNSARRKAWFVSYEEFLTDYEYPLNASTADVPDASGKKTKVEYKADADMTKDEKLMDFRRGLNCEKYDETYANYGYYFFKFLPWQSDLIQNSSTVTQENRIVMRYAEVLLLYAEACAQLGETSGDGLEALNAVAKRAGAPLYNKLDMENVKQEKWFELAWEGTRFWDLVRWGDAPKALAFKAHDETPYLHDDFYVHGSGGKMTSGQPHKAHIYFHDDGWAAKGGGWTSNKHELLPFPYDVIIINPWNEETGEGLKQNPGWE